MKKIRQSLKALICVQLVLVLFVLMSGSSLEYEPRELNLKKHTGKTITTMSFNVRTWSPLDLGDKSWFNRADLVLKDIESVNPDIIGFQEVTVMHYQFLTESLTQYTSLIQYRDWQPNSEGCPIFYRTDRFTETASGSFWLSETPEEMSKDWNSACYRICTYAFLKDKNTGKEFAVFCTHLDHISDEARINGVGVIKDKIKELGNPTAIIMGDFNCTEKEDTYKSVTKTFLDAKYQVSPVDHTCTYQSFGSELDNEPIDYFMISKKGIKVKKYKVITKTYNGVYPSDHFPILLKFVVQ